MANVIDYKRGERIDPVTGKSVKRMRTGAVPGDMADMLLPVASGAPGYFAPGFGSNLIENLDYYDTVNPPTPAPPPTPTTPVVGGNLPPRIPPKVTSGTDIAEGTVDHGRGRENNSRDNRSRAGAGAIRNFGDWARAVQTGMAPVGQMGPLTAGLGALMGEYDFEDDYGNYKVTQPEAWAAAVEEGRKMFPTSESLAVDYARQKMIADEDAANEQAAADADVRDATQDAAVGTDTGFRGTLGMNDASVQTANAPSTSTSTSTGSIPGTTSTVQPTSISGFSGGTSDGGSNTDKLGSIGDISNETVASDPNAPSSLGSIGDIEGTLADPTFAGLDVTTSSATPATQTTARATDTGKGGPSQSQRDAQTRGTTQKAAMGTKTGMRGTLGMNTANMSIQDRMAALRGFSRGGGSESSSQSERDAAVRGRTQAAAMRGPTGFRGTAGMNQGMASPFGGSRRNGGEGGSGGGDAGRSGQDAGRGGSRPEGGMGKRAMASGGYVTGRPTSVQSFMKRVDPSRGGGVPSGDHGDARFPRPGLQHTTGRPTPPSRPGAQQPAQQQPPLQSRFATMGLRRQMGAGSKFAAGGFVPQAGYADGGFIPNEEGLDPMAGADPMAAAPAEAAPAPFMSDEQASMDDGRFSPSPEMVADDGMIDNQPINADEGEYVVNRESAQILGPDALNAINDPETALLLSDVINDIVAMQGQMSGGGGAMGAPAPTAGAIPSGDMGGGAMSAGPDMGGGAMPQQRTAAQPAPGYNKGGMVMKRGRLSGVPC